MDISDNLLCLYSAQITDNGDSYAVELPKQEIELGTIQRGETYRVALISSPSLRKSEPRDQHDTAQSPPIEEGEVRELEIENIGDKGDGIARVERGYVVIVPEAEVGDTVTARVIEARENVAFAEVVERSME